MTFSLHVNAFQNICKEGASHVPASDTVDITAVHLTCGQSSIATELSGQTTRTTTTATDRRQRQRTTTTATDTRCLLHLALVLSKTMKISSSEDEAACQTHEECSQMREERAVQVLCDARAGMLRGAWRGRAHAWRGAMRMVRRRCGRGRDARRCRAHRARPPERAARARETNGCWAASHLCALRLAGSDS